MGCNWGEMNLSGSTVAFLVDNKQAFEFNLGVVSNATSSKKEAFVEFHQVYLDLERERERERERDVKF